ncbi:MAG: ATP-binding protein [Planctomycetota bacterium]|jgi:hypothetical protein
MKKGTDVSIIALDKFIQATRDSGYKGTYSAVSELVDNSLQAGAKHVRIKIFFVVQDSQCPFQIAVLDDGCGMDKNTLRQALRFGGSSRFNERNGIGRYGMGLPNSSLSQAQRVEVYTWINPKKTLYSYLDVTEIASGELTEVPEPKTKNLPKIFNKGIRKSGTLVLWTNCDRLSNRRISTITNKLSQALGRIFRHYIWDGVEIYINGKLVKPIDPTFQTGQNGDEGATVFGQTICYEIAAPSGNGSPSKVGEVTVTFTELPVYSWHSLTNEEKRRRGISNNAGVSIVRANREVDYGWFFMGKKRRENYDDWWRCEIHFDPVLDEAFGITHTKQQIRPQEYLNEILIPDIENMAKALNSRVRQTHMQLKITERSQDAEQTAIRKERLIQPLPKRIPKKEYDTIINIVGKQCQTFKKTIDEPNNGELRYSIREAKMKETEFFCFAIKNGHFILVINPEHPFYRKVYASLIDESKSELKELRCQVDLLLLASARAEALANNKGQRELLKKFRRDWSDILATFLSK